MFAVHSNELTANDYRALADFRYQIRQFLHFSEKAARSAGIQPQQHQLLLAVKGMEPGSEPTIGQVAARLHLRHHSVVELADRLGGLGLIRKRRAAMDRRRVLLEITRRGEALLRKLSIIHRAELKSLRAALINSLDELIHEKRRTG
jgi:DNA-binding MarR family transcriptional regulator